jgi:hypothetical protein
VTDVLASLRCDGRRRHVETSRRYTMSKRLIPVAAAAVLAGGVAALPATGQAPPAPTQLVFESLGRHQAEKFIDVRPRGQSVGDRWLFSSSLRRDGRMVGRMEGDCVGQDPAFEAFGCALTAIFADGQITLHGAALGKPLPGGGGTREQYAITGGTGAYVGASGTLRRTGDGRRDRLIFELAP